MLQREQMHFFAADTLRRYGADGHLYGPMCVKYTDGWMEKIKSNQLYL